MEEYKMGNVLDNYPLESKKEIKYSKRKIFLAAVIGALTGALAYIIYENLDNETKENFTKQLTKTFRNFIQNILPSE